MGHSLGQVLTDVSRQYQPSLQNSVEINYKWKLHTESDLGVPLAPTAMDPKSYDKQANASDALKATLHPDDDALLNWTGPTGDTAADNLKTRRDRARAAARMAGMGKVLPPTTATTGGPKMKKTEKKDFSRVLNDPLQTWMKKTTYLSNDYSRKVHDFKSLAKTKQELAVDLHLKQQEHAKRRSAMAIAEGFKDLPLQHPMRKNLKPKHVHAVLPNVENWGYAYTHVVVDKAPNLQNTAHTNESLNQAFVANVEKLRANARMSCQMWVPATDRDDDADSNNEASKSDKQPYVPVQEFDLDVVPLKEEDVPATNFCLCVDSTTGVATYLPLSSRVQLSTGRPVVKPVTRVVRRRAVTDQEREEMEERIAEVDSDLAEKHNIVREKYVVPEPKKRAAVAKEDGGETKKDDGEGEDDFGDDSSSDDEGLFGGVTKTIVAEG